MKRIKASPGEHQFPNKPTPTIECRKRDLVVRIADWTRTKDTPTYDVEVYIGGIYSYNDSGSFGLKSEAVEYAAKKIAEIL